MTARGMWDASKHLRGYHGRWAAGVNRSPEVRDALGDNSFRPRITAGAARARKEVLPSQIRDARDIYRRRSAGEQLSYKDRLKISWASPRKIAEQQRKTGDSYVPKSEFLARERSHAHGRRSGWRAPRTGVKRTFTGKKLAVRAYAPVPGVRRTGEARRLMGRD